MDIFVKNDGGRLDAGYKGDAGDCVTRAIAIATGLPYQEVYDRLFEMAQRHGATKRDRLAKRIQSKSASPRNGSWRKFYQQYLGSLGWAWVPTMRIGSGCKVHLKASELPSGRLVVKVSKHVTAVIDGVINDTYDCSRNGTRCVYGYFTKS
jgi:hypothetical protein